MKRLFLFVLVGLTCLAFQLLLLQALDPFMLAVLANAIGFLTSAQLNFVLSYSFTWGDSERRTGRQLAMTWLSFNSNVIAAAAANSLLFGLAYTVWGLQALVAAAIATMFSTISTFLLNHYFIFRQRGT